ncbi:thiamine/thiamine pyrophosphate ABC transporter permease ThiP [Photobacterium aphoticum]|uniref:Thiamine transport system permease protein ThiP n=1 Tax=Photobacterium aphoticum TaxID=754436 RepID=A0A0J1GGF8_9GAMM|nr:thiamine/thiamine pyrophosphate ABC transporter permease ThiP [Photobacterium aphoticum]KLU98779.1 thiamine ABC transporter permease [Photobacterium aphoticum]PSU50793.1 thiamine/thiamine pyrophosphate ABC transporter permease ThiP [Photobacterium aphoticum]GHA65312.1 thiamine/thiamine pyrophosphate ABC transporter permease ThiP [Photobacterium aphoticum]
MHHRVTAILPGLFSAGLIITLVISALGALIVEANSLDILPLWHDPYLRHVTGFSFTQALLSTLLSVVPAIPVAYALSRRQFRGKALLLRLFAMTLVLPVLVAVFGLLAIYGNNGLLMHGLHALGWQPDLSLYGLQGILLAHVFLNLPLATRLLHQSLEGIPYQQHQLATHLGLSSGQQFRFVAWPRLRQQLPHVIGLVFMLCFTSFAVIMALGGGPQATTIELAIYQALRYDFDLAGGAILALWQMLLCGSLVLITQRFAKPLATSHASALHTRSPQFDSLASRCWDSVWIGFAVLLVLPPLLAVVMAGLNPQTLHQLQAPALWQAVGQSLRIAILAALLAFAGGVAILLTSRQWRMHRQRWAADGLELIGTIILITPGLVLSTGIFLLLRQFTDAFSVAFWVVVAVNALMALPYVLKTLSQPMLHMAQHYDPLCQSLGMGGLTRLWLVEWRALRAPIAQALAISFVLSLGDLGAIALFGSNDFQTLPLYLFQLLGSYQMDAAAVTALMLLLLSLGLFTLVEKLLIRKPVC